MNSGILIAHRLIGEVGIEFFKPAFNRFDSLFHGSEETFLDFCLQQLFKSLHFRIHKSVLAVADDGGDDESIARKKLLTAAPAK